MATRPKEIVSEAIDRACVAMVPTSLKTELWSNSNSSNETRVTHYSARIYHPRVGRFSLDFKRRPSQLDGLVGYSASRGRTAEKGFRTRGSTLLLALDKE